MNFEDYMNLPYSIEIVPDPYEEGFSARIPDLPGCITCADNYDKLLKNIEDAKREWITAALEMGQEIPLPGALDKYSGQFKLRIPKSLHKELADSAKKEGISLNQYCLYLLSRNDALHNA